MVAIAYETTNFPYYFSITPLIAYEFKLNKSDMTYINKSINKSFILNRLEKYQTLKTEVKDYELIRKLSHINTFINRLRPAHDISTASTIDYWATPKSFYYKVMGIVKIMQLQKYFTLLELGIKREVIFCSCWCKGERILIWFYFILKT